MIQFWLRRIMIALGRLLGGLMFLVGAVELSMLLARTRGAEARHVVADVRALLDGTAKWGGAESEVSIFSEVVARSGSSGWILLMASLIAVGLGVPLGVWMARSRRLRGLMEVLVFPFGLVMWMPAFWMASLVVLYLVNVWQQPVYGAGAPGIEAWWRIFLPATVIAFGTIGWQIRVVSQRIGYSMHAGHVKAAKIRGHKPSRIFYRGVFRNSLDPIVRGLARSLPVMLGTLIIVEWVFRYPGIGAMTLEAAREANFGALMMCGASMLLLIVLVRCVSEILHGILDGQVIKRRGKKRGTSTQEVKA